MIKKQSLNGIWKWRSAGETCYHEGQVPGSVLNDMLHLGMIEDPYWRCNEYAVRELMMQDFLYCRKFQVSQEELTLDCAELVCFGLDTIAEIRVNGEVAARTNDMHCTYRIPVGKYLRAGENEVEILFSSALRFIQEEDASNDIFYASTGCIHGNASLRKAHSSFGWDWGPQLPDAGIFRDICLEFSSAARLEDVHIRQLHPLEETAALQVEAELRFLDKATRVLSLHVQVRTPEGEILSKTSQSCLLTIEIPHPKLWWPNGLGEQPLYEVTITLLDENSVELDRCFRRIGLRTVTVSTAPDEYGNEFALVVNNVKIFAMGANLIPEDSLLPRVTTERTRRMVEDCAAANFNCLRVWGGGYYPSDSFYDDCDELGILIWQDLMFACNVYALNQNFEKNIIAETADIAKRLRDHACMALWCGNNEMEWGWGDQWARIRGHHPRYQADYTKIFELILPRVLEQYDGVTFYWPSSPSSGGSYDDPNGPNRGDQHYWEVWHSGKPFTEYRNFHFRFCSEYGFQSFPCSKTIASFTLPEDRNIFSEVMESHQKNGAANSKIFTYVADYFLYPKDLDAVAYISQVLQLKAIQYGVEHWRRSRGRCMGSLYWQLNDCWPVASWASIDYFGRWKALHYGARRFYAPLTVSACEKEELSPLVTYYIHNDTRSEHRCTVEVALIDQDFQMIQSEKSETAVAALSAVPCLETDFTANLQGDLIKERFARCRLMENGNVIAESVTLFSKPKHFHYRKPQYTVTVNGIGDDFTVTVKASSFCQYVELSLTNIDAVFSDNFFDITSSEGITVLLKKAVLPHGITAKELEQQLTVRSVANTYELPGE